ncbi:MAG: HD domain-containing protein [Leptospiraceae bacterium]|nr:HD domain-containing protein [Leptospiraceae bacterium]MCP5494417.1 HD domain-containing protein [Leptospiraceae bacterium]
MKYVELDDSVGHRIGTNLFYDFENSEARIKIGAKITPGRLEKLRNFLRKKAISHIVVLDENDNYEIIISNLPIEENLLFELHNLNYRITNLLQNEGDLGSILESKETIEIMNRVIQNLKDSSFMYNLFPHRFFGTELFNHCVHTCLICLAIGIKLNYNEKDLVSLGYAGLLHDIGMTHEDIYFYISEPEYANTFLHPNSDAMHQIRSHVYKGKNMFQLGLRKSMKNSSLWRYFDPKIIFEAIEFHHWDWQNYPMLARGKPSDMARIVGMADFYDSKTTEKNYRIEKENCLRYSSKKVLDCILRSNLRPYIKEVAREVICPFPPNERVYLSGMVRARIYRINKADVARPIVILEEDNCEKKNSIFKGKKRGDVVNLLDKQYTSIEIYDMDSVRDLLGTARIEDDILY